MSMICIHHNDLDGRCAAAIVLSKFRHARRMIGMDYQHAARFDVSEIEKGKTVVIVDFSFPPEVMTQIIERAGDVIWIDHHKTAFDYPYNTPEIKGIRSTEAAACKLAWQFFYADTEVPRAVELISDRVNWNWNWRHGEETKLFNLGMEVRDTCPYSAIWADHGGGLLSNDCKPIFGIIRYDGEIAKRLRDMQNIRYRDQSFEVMFDGILAVANNLLSGSESFGNAMSRYPICISFVFLGDCWRVSLYSNHVDVSEIAKRYGGGGHTGAAGFVCRELPFKKIVAEVRKDAGVDA